MARGGLHFDSGYSVFLDVIDDDALRPDAFVALQHVEDEARAFELVFEMRRVDENELMVPGGEVRVHFEDLEFVPRVLVEPDFADAQDVRTVEELRNQGDDVFGQLDVLGFLGIDAEPGKMGEAEPGGALRLVFGELPEIVLKPGRRPAVEARPERRLANGPASRQRHVRVIVGDAADHVGVGFEIAHEEVERSLG